MMKKGVILMTLTFILNGCGTLPKPFEIKNICAQPQTTNAILQGYLSLPKTMDTIQLTKDGKIRAVGYQLFLMTKADETGDAVKVTIWMTNKAEPNKIKAFSNGYSRNDLFVYTDDGKEVPAGRIIKVTGETVPDEKTGCAVSVTKIETP